MSGRGTLVGILAAILIGAMLTVPPAAGAQPTVLQATLAAKPTNTSTPAPTE